ncbi:galactose oxidase, partial [Haematococcus lacustris]
PQAAFLDDVWRLDLRRATWQQLQPQGEALPKISRFQAVAVGDTHILIHHHRSEAEVLVLD